VCFSITQTVPDSEKVKSILYNMEKERERERRSRERKSETHGSAPCTVYIYYVYSIYICADIKTGGNA